jgi:hypothetical protein
VDFKKDLNKKAKKAKKSKKSKKMMLRKPIKFRYECRVEDVF